MTYRVHPDGTMSAIRRGRTPSVPEGFMVDPRDPLHYIPILSECYDRIMRKEKVPCCGLIDRMFCGLLGNRPIGYKTCLTCTPDTLRARRESFGVDDA